MSQAYYDYLFKIVLTVNVFFVVLSCIDKLPWSRIWDFTYKHLFWRRDEKERLERLESLERTLEAMSKYN